MAPLRNTRAALKATSATNEQAESGQSATMHTSATPATGEAAEQGDATQSESEEEQSTDAELLALRRRVQEKEEYTALLKRIQELEQEQESLSRHSRSENAPTTPAVRGGPRFEKHSLEYRGKHLQELRQWIRAVEDDHKNFPEVFISDQRRVFYASKALKPGSLAYKHWTSKREQVDSLDEISWTDFLDVLYDALGSKEARMARAYYDHMEAKWDPKKQSIVEFHRQLKGYEETFVNPVDDHYLYYQLWRQIPEEYRSKLIGTNKPKTRDGIVKAIEELDIDRKRDRSQSDAAKQSESKRPKHSSHSSNKEPRQTDADSSKSSSKESSKNLKESKTSASLYCNFCHRKGHTESNCYTKDPSKRPASSTQSNPNRIAVTTVPDSGKDQALLSQPQGQQRKNQ